MHLNGDKKIQRVIGFLSVSFLRSLIASSCKDHVERASCFAAFNAWMLYGNNTIINGNIQALSQIFPFEEGGFNTS